MSTPKPVKVEPTRARFRTLLAANPNYFGTAPEAAGFPVVVDQSSNTFYEELTCVSYSPRLDRLEATFVVKRPTGYAGDLCSNGSQEYVRFYIDYGGGWQDAGPASVNVHDIPVDHDCHRDPTHPLVYVCGVDHDPRRDWCGAPVLPRVRAILSWNLMPPAGQPNWSPPWGNHRDCHVQIRPRPFVINDIFSKIPLEVLQGLDLPPIELLEKQPIPPIPDPGPLAELPLAKLAKAYEKADVPPHRFALPHLAKAIAPSTDMAELADEAVAAKLAGISLPEVIDALDKQSGNTSYEELGCLGLEHQLVTDRLVATFHVKRKSGYSGPPCSAGSTEYVAFWADWDDNCRFEYLDTVETNVHDYANLPKDGLCYAAVLPVNLGPYRKNCKQPVLRRVRAVLSWGSPPSTTNPDLMPHWGNRLDTHVQIAPGTPYDGTARFTVVGGVPAEEIGGNGLTLAGAHLNGMPLSMVACPFAGRVTLHGPADPLLAGTRYRVMLTNTRTGARSPLINGFQTVDQWGHTAPSALAYWTQDANGWRTWLGWHENSTGLLGWFDSAGDDRWLIELELETTPGTFMLADDANVQLDHKLNVMPRDEDNIADLELDVAGQCEVNVGTVTGRFKARDKHFAGWNISVHGGPTGGFPGVAAPTTAVPGTSETTSGVWEPFSLNLSQLPPCGYTVRLAVSDRTIVGSLTAGRTVHVERGLCLRP